MPEPKSIIIIGAGIAGLTAGIYGQLNGYHMTALAQIPKPLTTAQDWAALGQKMLPFALPMAKWGLLSARAFAEKFRGPFLRRAVPQMFTWPEISTMVGLALLAQRYTGNWQGASSGWLLTRETMMSMIQGMEKTLPGLHNFYLAGQWVEPGGSVPMVAMSGRKAIQMICHEDERTFTAARA